MLKSKKMGSKKRRKEDKNVVVNEPLKNSNELEDENSFTDVELEGCPSETCPSKSAEMRQTDHTLETEENPSSDAEYDELCATVQERTTDAEQKANSISDDNEDDADSDEEELQGPGPEQQEINHNIHSDLVTPELSAEEKDQVPKPPKISHKKSHKKNIRSPTDDKHRKSSRKLEYQNKKPEVPLHKAIKRKLLPKSKPDAKKPKHAINKKKQLQERSVHENGTWVQCMHSQCLKWRYLREVTDPSLIPDYWICEKNTDPDHDSCEKPEEDYHSLEFVLTKYTEGSIVWAKMQGFPWWPAMIEEDPDTEAFLEQKDPQSNPSEYHVVFLDKNVSRTWLKSSFIRKYSPTDNVMMQSKGRNFKKPIAQAMERANHALTMSVQERIKTYGFSHTFRGKIVDDYEHFSEDELEDSGPSKDAPQAQEKEDNKEVEEEENEDRGGDSDVQFDLNLLGGLNVEDILEQAEALLTEAGETMQSLQGSTEDQEPPKKKRERKSKKGVSAENVAENEDTEAKKQRKHNKSSEGDKDKNKEDKKKGKHHHRHHHHHRSKKSSDEAESDPVSAVIVEGSNDPKSEAKNDELKNSMDEMIDDGLPIMVKHRSKKQSLPKEDEPSTVKDAKNMEGTEDGDVAPKPKEKKPRKQRAKKTDDESKPKTKKPRAKRTSSAKDSSTTADELPGQKKATQPVEDTLQEASQNPDQPSEPKPKKRSKKRKATDDTSGETSENLHQPKSKKKNSKKDDTTPRKKPVFKPPSKTKQDGLEAQVEKPSFNTPLAEKMDTSPDETTKDTLSNKSTNQTSEDVQEGEIVDNGEKIKKKSSAPKQKKLKKPDALAERGETSLFKGKVKAKFSVKKTSSLSSLQPKETKILQKGDETVMDDPSKNTEPKKKPGTSTESSKKFSIKSKTPTSKDAPTSPLQSTSPQMSDESPNNAAIPTDIEPDLPSKTSPQPKLAKKKFAVKRQQSPKCSSTVDAEIKEATTPPRPKKMKSSHEEQEKQQNSDTEDDDTLFIIEESPLQDDVSKETQKQGDKIDDGDDSDDFSMGDLDDWAQDVDVSDNPVPNDSNPLDKLTAGSISDSQPFETVEQ